MRIPHPEIHLYARRAEPSGEGGDSVVPCWDVDPLILEHDRVLHLDVEARPCDVSVAWIALQLLPDAPVPRVAVARLRDADARVLVNGDRAPSLAVARAGDEIAAAQGHGPTWRLHVTVYRPQVIAAAGSELSGRECAVCFARFSEGNRVFRCGCGCALHVADVTGAGGDLDCARAVAHCPDCRRAIVLNSGYEELPHDDNGREILPGHRSGAGADGVLAV
jgi:hypothetical protein